MRRVFSGRCARAASGHVAAAPPSAASNSRRPMVTVIRPSRAKVRKGNDTTPRACSLHGATGSGRRDRAVRGTVRLWNVGTYPGSLRLDAGELDHLGPLLGFVSDELSEFGRRHRHRHAPKVGEPRLKLGVGEDGIDLSVELLDDLGRRGLRYANAVPRTRLVTRHEIAHGRDVR